MNKENLSPILKVKNQPLSDGHFFSQHEPILTLLLNSTEGISDTEFIFKCFLFLNYSYTILY